MSIYLDAALMLAATLAGFVALAALWKALRGGGLDGLRGALSRRRPPPRRLRVQEVCPLDGRRRLSLVSCDGEAWLLLTGGPADLVVGRLAGAATDVSATGASA